jgi:hypothetical protein
LVAAVLGLVAQLAVITRVPLDTAQGVNFHAVVVPDTVYVGQQATYQVGVFIDDQLRVRLRRNPEFVPPDPQGMLAYELASASRDPGSRRVGHHVFEVHVFERALFPLGPGRYEVPSAELAYSLPLSLSFFSREENHTLLAESLAVVARAPPLAGRPADYVGAVGDLRVAEHLDSTAARVGDPMRFTVSVAGRGDVNLFPRPAIGMSWASTVPGQERVRLDTTTDEVRGTKEFDWLVTPHNSGRLAVPPIRYPYFNPYTERYEIAATRADSVRVAPGLLAQADTARLDVAPTLSIRTVYRGVPRPPLYQSPTFLVLALGGPLPALLLSARRRPRRRAKRPATAAETLRRLAKRQQPADTRTVRGLFVRALEARFRLGPTALTNPGALAHTLRREGVTSQTADRAETMLGALDRACFGMAATTESEPMPEAGARAMAIYDAVVAEARPLGTSAALPRRVPTTRGPMSGGTTAIVLVAATLVASGAWASTVQRDGTANERREFAAGVASYAAGDYASASAQFAAVTQLAPGAPDGWVNAGTAAWAAGDSSDAVVGWQRGGRLQPLAKDVKDRLALVRAPQDGPIASLPRVPAPWAADVALACWLGACSVATWRLVRRRSAGAFSVVACVAAAVVAAWMGVRADEAAAAAHLAVVTPGAALHAAPALDAERISRLDAGDVAVVLGTQGVWSDVRLDGDREGWIATAQLTSIARRGPVVY